MRATGIVRRVDDLGRVVIPKEIRRSMSIREGEPLEIFLDGRDTVCFRKYEISIVHEIESVAELIRDYCDMPAPILAKIDKMWKEIAEMVKESEEEEC